jgi:Fe-S-cluster-containing hydrogenase component 2
VSLDNEAVLLKREILIRVARHAWAGTLTTGLRKLPYEMTASGRPSYRCCVHHERAILRDRTLAVLGHSLETRDEAVDLNEAAVEAWDRAEPDAFPLTVVDEACKGCVHSRFTVTNACMGCVARPCRNVCPKGSVTVAGGRATIDPESCISCGKCHEACPYHAIIHIPVPCEEACPVGAVSKDDDGKEQIDREKCILCGKCITACPFGAVMEKSDLIRVVRTVQECRRWPWWPPRCWASFRAPSTRFMAP